MLFKGPDHLVYYITLNLNISASRQNIENLIGNFGAIHVLTMHAKFQASSLTGVGWEWGDRRIWDVAPDPYTKFLNSSLRFERDKPPSVPEQWKNWNLKLFCLVKKGLHGSQGKFLKVTFFQTKKKLKHSWESGPKKVNIW